MIYFQYDERKTAQATGVLLKLAGDSMDYYSLSKMLYVAERESLRKWNTVMFGGSLKSAPYGPIHQSALDSINHKDSTSIYWVDHIDVPVNNMLRLKDRNIENDELSRREINLLGEIFEHTKDFDFNDWKKYTHNFPEYEETASSLPIEIETILKKSFSKNDTDIIAVEAKANLRNKLSSIAC